jgi:hypothetical protein
MAGLALNIPNAKGKYKPSDDIGGAKAEQGETREVRMRAA